MNLNAAMLTRALRLAIGSTVAVLALVSLFVFILSLAAPEQANQLGLGQGYLNTLLLERWQALQSLLRLNLALDLLLLFIAYLSVCGFLWLQETLRHWTRQRRHFH